jgi:hypothetical protein
MWQTVSETQAPMRIEVMWIESVWDDPGYQHSPNPPTPALDAGPTRRTVVRAVNALCAFLIAAAMWVYWDQVSRTAFELLSLWPG